jgi:hypothetical protein
MNLNAEVNAVLCRFKVWSAGRADMVSETAQAPMNIEVESIPCVLPCLWVACPTEGSTDANLIIPGMHLCAFDRVEQCGSVCEFRENLQDCGGLVTDISGHDLQSAMMDTFHKVTIQNKVEIIFSDC